MMKIASVSELKNKTSRFLKQAQKDEELTALEKFYEKSNWFEHPTEAEKQRYQPASDTLWTSRCDDSKNKTSYVTGFTHDA